MCVLGRRLVEDRLLSALGVGSRPGRDLPRVFFFLLSKGALGCFVLSPSCHVPLSLPFVWGSRARYGYGTSVSDKEGRGDDQMRCSCLIRGHPRGVVPPFYPSLCRVRSVYEEGRCCTPGISAAPYHHHKQRGGTSDAFLTSPIHHLGCFKC